MSLIVDNLCKSLQEEIFWAFFWSFYNQFFAHVSAESAEHFVFEVVRK